jgi:VIT1/CCC1 family predicted Fe2+/Mn2+ transporter
VRNLARHFDRFVDLPSRMAEIVAGVIMALTFTGTMSAAQAGHAEVRTMLYAAFGCNIAWGIVDGILFMTARQTERARKQRLLRIVQRSKHPERARRIIREAIPPVVASVINEDELESIRARLAATHVPRRRWLEWPDLGGAFLVFLLVFLSTIPIAIPFLILHEPRIAIRVSNGVAVVMLFVCGMRLGHYAGHRAWSMGLLMAALGGVLVFLTILLGG